MHVLGKCTVTHNIVIVRLDKWFKDYSSCTVHPVRTVLLVYNVAIV